jgi:hypothetical protein
MGTSSAWTPERRAKQAEAIRRNKPWAKSTGPRTAEGKATSSRNADKGVNRELWRAWERASKARLKFLAHLIARDGIKPFGPPDQVGRKRRRSAEAQARYEEELWRLHQKMEAHPSLLELAQRLLNSSATGATDAVPGCDHR